MCPDWVLPVDYDYEIGEPWKKVSMFVQLVPHMAKSKIVYALGRLPTSSLIGSLVNCWLLIGLDEACYGKQAAVCAEIICQKLLMIFPMQLVTLYSSLYCLTVSVPRQTQYVCSV